MKKTMNILAFVLIIFSVIMFTLCTIATINPESLFLGIPISDGSVSFTDWFFGVICLIVGIIVFIVPKEK